MKKKKFKFRVKMKIEELSRISLSSGVFFCKARLAGGGDWSAQTTRESIVSNCVYWDNAQFDFPCKMSASPTTGVLETCTCRISVRKEVKGGKSHDKVGYADINLAEYAGAGLVTRHYILEGYHDGKKNRQDNCILKISASMMLTSGDLLFKPQVTHNDFLIGGMGESAKLSSSDSYITIAASRNINDDVEHLKRPCSDSLSIPTDSPIHRQHKRNISNGSNVFCRGTSMEMRHSGPSNHAFSHSRQSSNTTADSACADLDTCNFQSPLQRNKRSSHRRMNETRQNASDVIEQIFDGEDLTLGESNTDEGIELNMFLEDGVSTMSKIESRRHRDRGTNPFPTDVTDRFKTL